MSEAALVMVLLAVGTYLLKAAGPVVLGARPLPGRVQQVVDLLPAALLAALALVSTMGDGRALVVDARLAGLVAAGVALSRRAPFVVVVLAAALTTAVTRSIS